MVEMSQPSRKAKPKAIRLSDDLTHRLIAFGDKQLIKPTFTALIEKAMEEFLDRHDVPEAKLRKAK